MSGPRAVLLLLLIPSLAQAGLHYSGEEIAPLPSQWRGYLLDQRLLRTVAVRGSTKVAPSPMRNRYETAVQRLDKAARERKLNADELADLGALHLRLGDRTRALGVLRAAHKEHPQHFRIVANLGTAFQMDGELPQAASCLQQAVKLAPAEWKPFEEAHLKLVRLRQRDPDGDDLDDLFGVRFVNGKGEYEPGQIAAEQREKLSGGAAVVQQLGLWLPADGRLLWLLGELAGAHGDVRTAAAVMDGCVTEFGLRSRELGRHRQLMRTAADALEKTLVDKASHEGHAGTLKTRSSRPLIDRSAQLVLPPIKADGLNPLPWQIITETTVDRRYRPTFPKHLRELEGKQVKLTGFMQPVTDSLDAGAFLLIEYPVGCWYCEVPELIAMIYVELPPGKTHTFSRDLLQITGKLKLNSTDPEDFLYSVTEATVTAD